MPWSLVEGEIVEDANGVSWTEAIKQQRSLRANEARVASMYAELDSLPVESLEEVKVEKMEDHLKPSELVKIVVGNEQDRALTASVVQALEATNGRLEQTERMALSLAAALEQMAQPPAPVVNVTTPDVHVPPAQVTVEAPQITVQPADVIVPAPNITVHPEITLPAQNVTKTVTMERDYDGRLTSMQVIEGGEQPSQTT